MLKEYNIQLIAKVEGLTKRIIWNALKFRGMLDSCGKKTFGFKSNVCLLLVDDLSGLELDLLMLVHHEEFKIHQK